MEKGGNHSEEGCRNARWLDVGAGVSPVPPSHNKKWIAPSGRQKQEVTDGRE
jgi:hypothetical protein